MLGALLLALFVLPSALNVPVAPPQQTLEFAPIPPDHEGPPPPTNGNLASLGLGSSGAPGDAPGDGGLGERPPPPAPPGVGERPMTKRCVGDPPRQTEDPLAPPCVAFFEGDNGGATYRGVEADEIRVVFYFTRFTLRGPTAQGFEGEPPGSRWDVSDPPTDDDPVHVRVLRHFQHYFNQRYQTYGRQVAFHVHYDDGTGTPEARTSDALGDIDEVDPFASLVETARGPEPYLDAMAQHGVLNFGSLAGKDEAFFRRYPGLIWSYTPTLEAQVRLFASYVCTQVVDRPVSFSGNDDHGAPRVLGLLRSGDERTPSYQRFADLAREQIEACGGEFAATGTYPNAGYVESTRQQGGQNNRTAAQANIATFVSEGVTTVVWPQGYEAEHGKAAARVDYLPEWVVAGDGFFEGHQTGKYQDQEAWRHAWAVSPIVLEPPLDERYCMRALRETAPGHPIDDHRFVCNTTSVYEHLRQLFTGIQVAGPKLTPESIDQGFHAIPAIESTTPAVPACFYLPGDYTCVKDGQAMWWDPESHVPGEATPGCWRGAERGQRHFPGTWPEGDVVAQRTPDDPCNTYLGSFEIDESTE